MTCVMTFDFPIVNFLYLSINIPESPTYDILLNRRYIMLVFLSNMKISVQRIYSGFKVIEAGLFFSDYI